MQIQEVFEMFKHLVAICPIDILAGDFNYDLLIVLENKLFDFFTEHVQMVNKPTRISGSLTDHVYIKKV